jgi:hypothetical protein
MKFYRVGCYNSDGQRGILEALNMYAAHPDNG